MGSVTLPGLLLWNKERFGAEKIALREKEFGIWQEYSWKDYYEHVKNFSLGLEFLGFQKGDKLAIIGDNRPEWVWAELATQSLGGIPLGIYQDSILTEVAYVINQSEATIVVAEDQEQCDKILALKEKIPGMVKIIYTDPKGMRSYDDPLLISFPEVEALGKERDHSNPQNFETRVQNLNEEDIAFIAYTSGTTGFPKGSILTQKNMITMAKNLNQVDPKYEKDEFVSFLPLPWVGEQMMAISTALSIGFTVNFPEQPETAMEDLYEIGPNVIFSPPRIWEGLSRSIMVKISDASFFKRLIYNLSLPIGYQWADFKFEKVKPPWYWKALYFLTYIAVFRALKDRLGFSKIRSATTGGALLGPDVFRFFHALGIELKQIYGQTEISGISTIHRLGDVKFDTVGLPIPETDIKISEEGEILSRSPALFQGYWKNPEATAEALKDGWLHSGDAGYFTKEGHLVCIDRVKDLMQMANGTKFSPLFIENKLKFCPYIVEAVVIGHQKPFIGAILSIDFKHTGKWAEEHGIPYTTYSDLSSKKEVYKLIEKEVYRVNKTLPKEMQIRKFTLLYKELDADDEELTRTRKVRRGFINEKYKREIDAIYGDQESISVETLIKYQDGRTATVQRNLYIHTMKSDEEYEALLKKRKWWMRRGNLINML
jgi:long-chain acyl-CoA synthetase